MKPPTRKLIGGWGSHIPGALVPKISSNKRLNGEIKGTCSRTARTKKPEEELVFLRRKRENEGRDATRGHGAHPGGWVARPGARPRHLAFWLGGGPPGQPQVPSDGLSPENFEYNFFVIFWVASLLRIFQILKSCKNFHELEAKG